MSNQPRIWAVWSDSNPDHLIGTYRDQETAERTAHTWYGTVEPLFSKDADR